MAKEKKRRSIFIIHFQPLERFPPVTNLLDYLADHANEKIVVVSTSGRKESMLRPYFGKTKEIIIKRTPGIIPGSFLRMFHYAEFYLCSLFLLIKKKPASVLYFETLSSWPSLMYKKLRGDKVKLLLHCHEYTGPENYNDMWLIKNMHSVESKMYSTAYEWISHTNEVRLQQFKRDHSLESSNRQVFHVMPNYPPKSWSSFKTDFGSAKKTRLVFVGSLGYNNMYLQETVDWVLLNKEFLTLDIYAYNIDKKARELLQDIQCDSLRYFGGCDYNELPRILKNYDVGLLLYKPYNFNHIYGVSNKVYEYLACGLDVWFPEDNTFMLSLTREKVYPKIIALDFKRLSDFDFKKATKRVGLEDVSDDYFYENVYDEIYKNLSSHLKKKPE